MTLFQMRHFAATQALGSAPITARSVALTLLALLLAHVVVADAVAPGLSGLGGLGRLRALLRGGRAVLLEGSIEGVDHGGGLDGPGDAGGTRRLVSVRGTGRQRAAPLALSLALHQGGLVSRRWRPRSRRHLHVLGGGLRATDGPVARWPGGRRGHGQRRPAPSRPTAPGGPTMPRRTAPHPAPRVSGVILGAGEGAASGHRHPPRRAALAGRGQRGRRLRLAAARVSASSGSRMAGCAACVGSDHAAGGGARGRRPWPVAGGRGRDSR